MFMLVNVVSFTETSVHLNIILSDYTYSILYAVPLNVDSISQCVFRQNLKTNSLCRESSCLLFRIYSVYWTLK